METIERGKSLVNIVPRNNEVLIKMEFKVSLLALTSGKPNESDSNERVTYIVAGKGPLVKDLELEEEVLMKVLPGGYDDVPVKENMRSIRELTNFYDINSKNITRTELTQLMSKPETNKVNVIQYGMFPEFQIKGHIE